MSKLSRTKGHSFERETAIAFRKIFPGARRHLEYHGEDAKGFDIDEVGIFRIQCKRERKYSNIGKIFEVQTSPFSNEVPLLVTKGDSLPAMVVMSLEHFLALLQNPVDFVPPRS